MASKYSNVPLKSFSTDAKAPKKVFASGLPPQKVFSSGSVGKNYGMYPYLVSAGIASVNDSGYTLRADGTYDAPTVPSFHPSMEN